MTCELAGGLSGQCQHEPARTAVVGSRAQGPPSRRAPRLFRAETDVWTLFRKILSERKRRELDPSLEILDRTVRLAGDRPELADLKARVESLRQFFGLIDCAWPVRSAVDAVVRAAG